MEITTDKELGMLDSSAESNIDEDPDFLLSHKSETEEESVVATTSASFPVLTMALRNL